MSLERVISVAKGEVGTTEYPPNSNQVKYWDAYDPNMQGQPWCVAFLWWCFDKAGERMAFFGGGKTPSCGIMLRWYKEQGLTVPVEEVKPGDIVLLNFNGKGTPDHCGLVVDYSIRIDPKTGAPYFVETIDGNTTPGLEGSQDNGGSVALKSRDFWNIVAVCRPKYQLEQAKVDDVSGHWYSKSIEWAREKDLLEGYPDGSFKPNNPITRAEACTMVERLYKLIMEGDKNERMDEKIT